MERLKIELQSDRMIQYDEKIWNQLLSLYAFYAEQAQQMAIEQMKMQLLMEQGAQPAKPPAAKSVPKAA
jgi:hypothetical protein